MEEPERYFFLRFQKTGSTALTQLLRTQFGDAAVYPGAGDHGHVEAVLWVDYLTERFRTNRDELRVIAGHFPLSVVELLDAPFRTFTILRDPVERTLSLLRSRAQRGAPRFQGQPLEALYEDPELQDIIRNHMVKMLTLTTEEMGSMPLTLPVTFDDARLERAKQRLADVEVIGLQERFNELCAALEERFGWDLGPRRFSNRTDQQPISSDLRKRIAADNQADIELYEFARELLEPKRLARTPPVATVSAPKIVITGTGRSGTTLLVRILDALGLDTGLADGKLSPYGANVRAGLESRVDDPDAPTVVKDMTLGFRLRELLDAGTLDIEFVILPDRQLDIAAASRIRASAYGGRPFGRGRLTGTMRATEQARVLADLRAELISTLDHFEVPYTILEFPRFALDAAYTHAALAPVAPDATLEDVERALAACVRPEFIHETPLSGRERWRMWLTTTYMVLYRYPIARLRARVNPEAQQAKIRASVAAARKREAEDGLADQ